MEEGRRAAVRRAERSSSFSLYSRKIYRAPSSAFKGQVAGLRHVCIMAFDAFIFIQADTCFMWVSPWKRSLRKLDKGCQDGF